MFKFTNLALVVPLIRWEHQAVIVAFCLYKLDNDYLNYFYNHLKVNYMKRKRAWKSLSPRFWLIISTTDTSIYELQ